MFITPNIDDLKKLHQATVQVGIKYACARLLEKAVSYAPIISQLYWKMAPKFYNWKYSRQFKEYEAPIQPCEPIWINPSSIQRKSEREKNRGVGRRKDFIGTSDGDWDKSSIDFMDSRRTQMLIDRFENGLEWEKTDFYKNCMKQLSKEGHCWHGCESKEDVNKRCKMLDELYIDVRNSGYERQLKINKGRWKEDYINLLLNEIIVDIGRDGEILFVDGRHRCTIAKILDLDRIPVICDHRHEDWMVERDRRYQQKQSSHPDDPLCHEPNQTAKDLN